MLSKLVQFVGQLQQLILMRLMTMSETQRQQRQKDPLGLMRQTDSSLMIPSRPSCEPSVKERMGQVWEEIITVPLMPWPQHQTQLIPATLELLALTFGPAKPHFFDLLYHCLPLVSFLTRPVYESWAELSASDSSYCFGFTVLVSPV